MKRRFQGHPNHRAPFALCALAVTALCAVSGSARAQYTPPTAGIQSSNPYYLRISETLTYDNNIFRVPEGQPLPLAQVEDDLISTTALSAGIDQPFGRQRALANATVRGNVFKNNDDLNNTGFDLNGQLKWEAGSAWGGDAKVSYSETLADYEDYGSAARTSGKNMEKVGILDLRAQYGLYSLWSIEGLYNHYDIDYTADNFQSRVRRSDQAGLGVKYRPSGLWTFGLIWRETRGEYPYYRGIAPYNDDYDRTDVDLTARYFYTGLSTFSARISYTNEDHSIDSTRDFNGTTGEIRWDYQVTGKVGVSTILSREIGSGSSTTSIDTGGGTSTSYLTDSRLTNRIVLNARWAATAKITVRAGLDFSRDEYDDQFTSVGGVVSASGQTADSKSYRLSAAYQLSRAIGFECGYRYQKRDPIISGNQPFFGYNADTGYCLGALSIQ
jgi:hypothetical protein